MDHGSIGREGDQAAGLPFDAAAAATSEAAARHPSEMTTDVMSAAIVHVDVTGATQRAERRALVADAFAQYHAEIYNFLRRSTRDESVAEDLVQETFVRLNREVEAGRTPEHLRAWLYRVASNLVILGTATHSLPDGGKRPIGKVSDIDAGGHRRVPDSDNWARWAVSDP